MNDKDLYLATISDIESKLSIGDEYSLIRAAGLLRQLFLDSRPLAHWVNRETRIKLSFVIMVPDSPFTNDELIGYLDVSPASDRPMRSRDFRIYENWLPQLRHKCPAAKTVKIDEFLSATCLVFHQQPYSIKEIIQHCSNVLGGVHLGSANEDQILLMKADRTMGPVGRKVTELITRGIVQVVLDGLAPLTLRLQQDGSGRESNPLSSPIAAGASQGDKSPCAATAPSPEADYDLSKTGTISYWCNHPHRDWPINSNQYVFGTTVGDGIAFCTRKLQDGHLQISIAGPMRKHLIATAPIPECGPNGLHVVIVWSDGDLRLYLNSRQAAASILEMPY